LTVTQHVSVNGKQIVLTVDSLHGYAVSFRVWFEGELDHRNWVWDFGGMKRAKAQIADMSPKDYFAFLLDHTTIVAIDDPYLETI
jgi:6-pyruvoyltetrahydropterin/6-carboxytetrahydropterin synthase